jgi:hypothetical protein
MSRVIPHSLHLFKLGFSIDTRFCFLDWDLRLFETVMSSIRQLFGGAISTEIEGKLIDAR